MVMAVAKKRGKNQKLTAEEKAKRQERRERKGRASKAVRKGGARGIWSLPAIVNEERDRRMKEARKRLGLDE